MVCIHRCLILLSVLLGLMAEAAPFSPPNCANEKLFRKFADIHKVTVIDEESRVTIEAYAKQQGIPVAEARKRFAATGTMFCHSGKATVQLTGRNDVITTVAHALVFTNCASVDPETCDVVFPFSNNPKRIYKIDRRTTMTGSPCFFESSSSRGDWAVAKLKAPVTGVTPYLAPPDNFTVSTPTEVLQAASSADNFVVGKTHPFNLTNCRIVERGYTTQVPLTSNCDNGGWTSGAAQLVQNGPELRVVAVVSNSTNAKPSGSPYNSENHFNISVPLEGEFLKALKDTLK